MPLDQTEFEKALTLVKPDKDLDQFLQTHTTPSDGAPLVLRLSEFKKMYEAYEKKLLEAGTQKWFVPGTLYSIDNCPRHKAFFKAGSKYPERIFLAGNRCLAEGTLVATPKGPVAIEKLSVGDTVYAVDGTETTVSKVWDNGTAEVVELVNRGKVWARATPNHKFWTTTVNTEQTWNVNDNVKSKTEVKDFSYRTLVNRGYTTSPLGDVNVPEAYVLGAMLGDGCCTCGSTNRLVISSQDELVPNKVAQFFGSTPTKAKGSYSWSIPAYEKPARYTAWLADKLCHEKTVDLEDLSSWNRTSLLEFVAGLVDTDGAMSRGNDGFCLQFHNQSLSAVTAFGYAVLALWNEPVTYGVDNRAKYKNGPVHRAYVRNPYAIKRICDELKNYVVHQRKLGTTGIEAVGKRSRAEAIKLTAKPAGKCRVFDITVDHPSNMYMLANGLITSNCGKTVCGAIELSYHLTGIYPEWWEGKRFEHPIEAWAAGQTGQTTRDTVQKELLGGLGRLGTGTIPKECIVSAAPKNGIAGAIDIVRVKHSSGGVSVLGFKSYDQDIKAFYGTAKHVIWLDEECPALVYNECLIRTMTTNGILYVTFTPLQGVSRFIVDFCRNATYLEGALPISVPADDLEKEQDSSDVGLASDAELSGRAVIQAGWDHAPWLDEEMKRRLEANTPWNLRAARRNGTPSIGGGNVYPLALEDIVIDDFEIPGSWPRLYGLDVGWNKTAAVWAAVNPSDRMIYVYSEHYSGKSEPEIHAASIKSRGEAITGVIDPAARGRSQKDGLRLIDEYKKHGLKLAPADNSVEAGMTAVWSGLSTGKIKIFKSLVNLQREYLVYRRDDNGKVIKEHDHLMDALRYLILSIHLAKTVNIRGLRGESSNYNNLGGYGFGGIKYDL